MDPSEALAVLGLPAIPKSPDDLQRAFCDKVRGAQRAVQFPASRTARQAAIDQLGRVQQAMSILQPLVAGPVGHRAPSARAWPRAKRPAAFPSASWVSAAYVALQASFEHARDLWLRAMDGWRRISRGLATMWRLIHSTAEGLVALARVVSRIAHRVSCAARYVRRVPWRIAVPTFLAASLLLAQFARTVETSVEVAGSPAPEAPHITQTKMRFTPEGHSEKTTASSSTASGRDCERSGGGSEATRELKTDVALPWALDFLEPVEATHIRSIESVPNNQPLPTCTAQFLVWPPAQVWIDGRYLVEAPSPESFAIPAGSRKVRLVSKHGQEVERQLALSPGKGYVVKYNFDTSRLDVEDVR